MVATEMNTQMLAPRQPGHPVKTEITQRPEHGIGRTFLQFEKDGIAVRPTRGSVKHDQVLHTRNYGQSVEQRTSNSGAHDAHVQHHEPTSAGISKIMASGQHSAPSRQINTRE